MGNAREEEKEMIMQGLYELWLARNETKEGKNIVSPHEILRSVALYMAEWMSLHVKKDTAKPVTELQLWSPPDEGWVKANLDAGIV